MDKDHVVYMDYETTCTCAGVCCSLIKIPFPPSLWCYWVVRERVNFLGQSWVKCTTLTSEVLPED